MKKILLLLVFVLISYVGKGQTIQPQVIDLANLNPNEASVIDIDAPTTISIDIINSLFPFSKKYIVSWEYSKLDELGDPLTYISPEPASVSNRAHITNVHQCDSVYAVWLKKMQNSETEKSLITNIDSAEVNLYRFCGSASSKLMDSLREMTIVRKFLVHEIAPGWQLTINISRMGSASSWKVTYRSRVFNHWRVYYGASFVFNMMSPVTTYFSQATDTNSYVITAKPSDHVVTFRDFAPVVFYTWIPEHTYHIGLMKSGREYLNKKHPGWAGSVNLLRWLFVGNGLYRMGFSFGLNANLTKPSIFAAPSLIIGNNASLSFGTTIYPKYHLRDQYHPDQVIGESLDFDQLHQVAWYGEWFVCLAIRFNSPPFIRSDNQ